MSREIQYFIAGCSAMLAIAALGSAGALYWRTRRSRASQNTRRSMTASDQFRLEAARETILKATSSAALPPLKSTSHSPRIERADHPETSPPAPTLIRVPNVAQRSKSDSPSTASERLNDPRIEAVDRLSNAGRPLEEIAHETGLPAGQVELMLRLRQQRSDRASSNLLR